MNMTKNKSMTYKVLLAACAAMMIYVGDSSAQSYSASVTSGAVVIGPYAATCDGTTEGILRYNSSTKFLEFCDGTDWRYAWNSRETPPAPSEATSGYFVITNDTFDGNLGGIEGANDKCLTDLQTYDWQGKTGMTLDDEHVFAFNCYGSYTCTILSDSDTYTFAVSGDNSLGGDSFTTNASNEGPGDTAAWNTSTRFGTTAKQYWAGYRTGSSSYWRETNGGGDTDSNRCGSADDWNTNSAAQTGVYGDTSATGTARWDSGTTTCDTAMHLVCVVLPN